MISFGSAAGWRISSGWGSKVSTVSAPSITAWWPSVDAVEGADRDPARARLGVGQRGDLDLGGTQRSASPAAGTSSPTRSRSISSPASSTLNGPIAVRRSSAAVGVAEGLDQGADVGAGGAFDLVAGRVALVAVEQLGPVDVDLALGRLDDLAPVGLPVEPLAADPDRGGHRQPLADPAGRQLERLGHAPGLGQLAVGIAGARAPAEPGRGQVGLRQAGEEALDPGRPAEQDQQQAGREGVERAGVAGLAPALASHPRNHVVRGYPRRLVAEQHRALASGPASAAELSADLARRGTR